MFHRTIEGFLKDLRKQYQDLFARISAVLTERYLDREGYFCDPKPSDGKRSMQAAASDAYLLLTEFANAEDVCEMESYQLLKRLFSEQCEVSESDQISLESKPSSDNLQNPSDPDAGYSGHKREGISGASV